MKKLLYIPIFILSLFTSTITLAQEVINIPDGKIAIKETKVDFINLHGKTIHIPVAENTMSVSLKEKFPLINRTILVFEENNGGNGCPSTYFVYQIHINGETEKSPSFGTCSDLLQIKQYNDKLVMTMPSMAHKGKDIYVYQFKDGTLLENNKVLK